MAKRKLLIYITKSCTHLNIRKTCAKFCNIGLTNAHHPCHCNTARFFWEVTAVKIAVTLLEMEEKVGNKSKGRILNQFFKKTKHVKSSEKRTFLTQRNARFSENLACFVFLKHPFWDALFCLITGENNKIYSSGCSYRTRSWLVRRLGWQKFLKCKFRSSRLRIFFKIVVLKNFAIFGENLCWSPFLRKLWSNDSMESVSLWILQKFEYTLFLKK